MTLNFIERSKKLKIKALFIVLLVPALVVSALDSTQAAYPEKSVTMLCGFPAGGALDMTARAIVEAAKDDFPKGLVVVNRPGAVSTIANAEVMQAKPDGYTIGIGAVAPFTVFPHRKKLPYDTPDDYMPLMNLVDSPECLAVKADSPFKTLEEFVDYAKKNPGKIRVGMTGRGTIFHLNMLELIKKAGIDLTLVPFQGGAKVVPALLGGHVDAACLNVAEIIAQVKAGKSRVLATLEEKRNSLIPDVPTFKERGYDITMNAYYFLFCPKDLPQPVADWLLATFKKAMKSPIFIKPIRAKGLFVHFQGPTELKDRLWKDYKVSAELVKAMKAKKK
jgi:tripartite-type tricarboxylate transporter receptor subunit TctC